MRLLDPKNKTNYCNGDLVEFLIGDTIYRGTIAAPASTPNVIDYWVVNLSEKIDGWDWGCAVLGHNFLRLCGDNNPFICERSSSISY